VPVDDAVPLSEDVGVELLVTDALGEPVWDGVDCCEPDADTLGVPVALGEPDDVDVTLPLCEVEGDPD
jgi:hypothetical protein